MSAYSEFEHEFHETRRAIRRDARISRIAFRALLTLFLTVTAFDLAVGTRLLLGKFMLLPYLAGIAVTIRCARGNDACERRELKKLERLGQRAK